MTERHLNDLEIALTRAHWVVLERLAGNDYDISGYWVIARPDGASQTTLVFNGLDDLKTLPMHKSYGCTARSVECASLYFAGGLSWKADLGRFIYALESQ